MYIYAREAAGEQVRAERGGWARGEGTCGARELASLDQELGDRGLRRQGMLAPGVRPLGMAARPRLLGEEPRLGVPRPVWV